MHRDISKRAPFQLDLAQELCNSYLNICILL